MDFKLARTCFERSSDKKQRNERLLNTSVEVLSSFKDAEEDDDQDGDWDVCVDFVCVGPMVKWVEDFPGHEEGEGQGPSISQ